MAFKSYNPNPKNNLVIDCTVRAISTATPAGNADRKPAYWKALTVYKTK